MIDLACGDAGRGISLGIALSRPCQDLAIGLDTSGQDETGLPLTTFPEECPFTVEQITGDYWPD